jgi:hypothetical protein
MATLSDKAATPDAKCRQLAAPAVPALAHWLAVTPSIKFGAAGQTFPSAFREAGGSGCRKVEDHASLNSLSVCWDVQQNGPKLSLKLPAPI